MASVEKKELYRELGRLGICLGIGIAVGLVAGSALYGTLAASIFYLFWQLAQVYRLVRWLGTDTPEEVPEGRGIWSYAFDRIYRLQKKQARQRQQLQDQADSIRQALSSSSQAVVMVNAHGSIDWCNETAASLLGVRYPEDQGQLIVNLVRDPEFVEFFNGQDYSHGLKLISPVDDVSHLRFELTEFGDGNRLLFARDITRIAQLERMRVDFIANVSHELRTPLTVINGYIENLRTVMAGNNELALKALEHMHNQSERMGSLVEDLMWLSKLESVPISNENQQINVAALIAMIVDDQRAAFGEKLSFTVDVPPDTYLMGQEKEIHSAFGNLVSNACKYTPEGGEVNIAWYLSADEAVFEVSDTGVGIPPEHIPRLTERFYRVDKSRSIASGGTGLGLAIVKHVLLRHHAHLEISSTPGKGSTFQCVFPKARLSGRAA